MRAWRITAALAVTETVSYGILYYAFAAFLVPMERDLGFSTAEITGAFSLAILVSAPAGIAVGRHLDRHGPRALMTLGSLAGALLLVALSRVESLAAFYAVWAGVGLVMAAVLYEAAFTVVAKQFAAAGERRRAMTAMTLVAALASFIFVPLSQVLIDAYGWRDALAILALVLLVVTVPLHAVALRGAAQPPAAPRAGASSVDARPVLRSAPFRLLSAAFFLASLAAVAMTVHTIPYLLERGYGAGFAAFAVGLVGVAQIPGRILFSPVAARASERVALAVVFGLVAIGIAVVVSAPAGAAVVAGLVLIGMGNGMATLARATTIADRWGQAAYGTISGAAAASATVARAAAPVAAAGWAVVVGYRGLLWSLALLAAAGALLAWRSAAPVATRSVASRA